MKIRKAISLVIVCVVFGNFASAQNECRVSYTDESYTQKVNELLIVRSVSEKIDTSNSVGSIVTDLQLESMILDDNILRMEYREYGAGGAMSLQTVKADTVINLDYQLFINQITEEFDRNGDPTKRMLYEKRSQSEVQNAKSAEQQLGKNGEVVSEQHHLAEGVLLTYKYFWNGRLKEYEYKRDDKLILKEEYDQYGHIKYLQYEEGGEQVIIEMRDGVKLRSTKKKIG